YGAAANIVAIPLTTFIVMPAEALALVLDGAGVGAPAWWVVDHALALLLWMAHGVAGAPGASMAMPGMTNGVFAIIIAGGLWLVLVTAWTRVLGAIPILAGMAAALLAPPPDMLITGDGRHVAIRIAGVNGADDRYALLRERSGDFVRDQLAEAAGIDSDMGNIADQKDAACSPDFCVWQMRRGHRRWTIMATKSSYQTDWAPLVAACAHVDIVIADRRMPRGCHPRWLLADRRALQGSGGMAIFFEPLHVRTVAQSATGRPWANPMTIHPERQGNAHPQGVERGHPQRPESGHPQRLESGQPQGAESGDPQRQRND
ncbi:MAG: ComEC/Rec2 family competence protein, partial [Sphingopyxis sp.]